MPELSTADADEIKAWKLEKHLGSPTSILFFTQEQLRLWDERKVLPTHSVVFNGTSTPWQQQSKRSPTGSIPTLEERA